MRINTFLVFVLVSLTLGKKAWIVTDTHFDDLYAEGSAAKCYTVDCCHSDSVPRKHTEDNTAGRCGNFNCYPPLDTVTSSLDYIREHKSESNTVFWLMDVVPGDVLNQSNAINQNRIKMMADQFKKKLPGFNVYPVPGNHDYFLSSEWEYPPRCQWMLEFMNEQFKNWLSPQAQETFKKGGYYSELIDSGIRLIALNLVYVDKFSIHSKKYNEQDPGDMVAWFNQTLKQSKANGEKVIIISHEGIGLKSSGQFDLEPAFNNDFTSLMKDYSDIVITHFAGHSHYQSFRILPNIENPFYHVILNPAVTTWSKINPKFRLVEFDQKSVKDYTTFVLDINECNAGSSGYPWKKEHSFKETYGINDMSTEGLKELYNKLQNDDALWRTFMQYFKDSSYNTCDGKCKKGLLCALSHLTEAEYKECTK
ncbi:hypothetical protein ENUP19_0361G0035 [Entamoeba nuttalli]|uniref:Acid sphingomyelinase family phosphodiesterase, putative n=2 Tax=Entamoeba nuttalli TaxID=412467 RepID=K2H187_ENTNP|nr:acid sphingomyelinase family phosphodiesterase, putative [Entamoeba nuttalli P19]EKE41303.1 acid sphingomyelinase family phosphodiesterase, putative [Entamoeba nuttalli P19]|eukprot:XP_008856361.1 acid sphingomyelinase family phosphodiesterase, putative [Entamoeba nuttalli P19]